jgi:tRNA(Ile)-lysidine synthase
MLDRVRETVARHGLFERGDRVVVAVSGGADSVALLYLLRALAPGYRLRLVVAHLHHGIRGQAADADATFVAKLTRRLGLRLARGRADVPRRARRSGLSLEMAARQARYDFLVRTARRFRANVIATGHTADDQAETLLLRLIRGAGMQGLRGIPPRQSLRGLRVVRPLLDCTRTDIERYLRARRLAWREDESNRDPAILRNRVRHQLIPWLENQFNPEVRSALVRAGSILAADHDWLDQMAASLLAECTVARTRRGRPGSLVARSLAAAPLAARRRVLRAWLERGGVRADELGFTAVERLERLLHRVRGSEQLSLPRGWIVRRRYGTLALEQQTETRRRPTAARIPLEGESVLPELGIRVVTRLARGVVKERGRGPGRLPARASLDPAARRGRALRVRTWRPGDRIRPFGMEGSRKIHDVLVDAKVPRDARRAIPLLVCGREVVWVPGYRISRDWAVGDPACNALQIRMEPVGEGAGPGGAAKARPLCSPVARREARPPRASSYR